MDNLEEEGTHIKFVPAPPKPKTKVWWVVSKYDGLFLGWVGWFPRWRKYAFFPQKDTVYEEVCLREIADFCVKHTKAHKVKPPVDKGGEINRINQRVYGQREAGPVGTEVCTKGD